MRVYNYIIIMVGIMIVLNLMGVNLLSTQMLEKFNVESIQNFALSDFMNLSFTSLLSLTAGAIIIGLVATGNAEVAILFTFAGFLLLFVADFVSLLTWVNQECAVGEDCRFLYYIMFIVFVPLMVGYVQSIFSWVGGRS